jgi:general stress protein YciG
MKIPKKRGFAAMTLEQRQEIASMGGKAVPPEKRSFAQDKALAASAGKKGGAGLAPDKRTFWVDRDLAASAGRKARKKAARSE